MMKIIVIGGVAAGTKAAAKIRRGDRDAQVKVLTKSMEISYAGCGLPYYIGGVVPTRDALIVNTPEVFEALTGAEVTVGCEVTSVDTAGKQVSYRLWNGEEGKEPYDKLVIATGAVPFMPSVDGMDLSGIFPVRTPDDANEIQKYMEQNDCRRAVVCGAGFIGLEVAENLMVKGLSVTVIDAADTIMPNAFDPEMANYAKKQLQKSNITVMTGTKLLSIIGREKAEGVETDAGTIPADLVIMAIGIRPATKYLEGSGIDLFRGTVLVDDKMQTNVPGIYAAGDCAMVQNRITKEPQWSAMGSTANITARLLAENISGIARNEGGVYPGCLGTGVAKILPHLNCGRTGMTERDALQQGYDAVSAVCVVDDKPHYEPSSASFVMKMIADRGTRRLLGMQVFGPGAVDKMVDIGVSGISLGARLEDYDTMDFAYSPPFSTAISPFVTACYILENKLSGQLETITPLACANGAAEGYTVIDVHPAPTISRAKWVDLAKADGGIDGIGKEERLLLICEKGKRSYFLQNRLKHAGYTGTKVLEGGTTCIL
jgi:NADPH-dependent 2,4-dienoyl-CoA reductase/sulfur reductase-like enzyme/rhodanese-related sulfurtransferase